MYLSMVLVALVFPLVYGSPVASTGAVVCHDFLLPVNASAQSTVLPKNLTLNGLKKPNGLTNLLSSTPSTIATGTYGIAGRYCEPINTNPKRANTLQVLVHGITYNRDYWSGLAPPGTKPGQEQYSWVDYAGSQGYATLAVDRLCNGKSSHLDGLADCQLPLEADALASTIQAARQGSIPGVDRKFSNIITVGHSYGSLVANYMSIKYPKITDALVMTGWSSLLPTGISALLFQPLFLPAKIVNPATSLADISYLMATDKDGARNILYHGNYSQTLFDYDYAHRQTLTLGEAVSALLGGSKAPDYRGPIFVLNGNEDAIFCSLSPVNSAAGLPGDCQRAGAAQEAKKLYPAASSFGYNLIPNTGHCVTLHDTAMDAFKAAHDWLESQEF